MSSILIKSMQPSDVQTVFLIQTSCYQAAFHESVAVIAERLGQSPHTAWVAWMGQHAVGYLVAYPSVLGVPSPLGAGFAVSAQPSCLYIHDLAVAPSAAGCGVAAQLIEHALQYARRQGWHSSALVAVQHSQAFWQKYGYQPYRLDTGQQQYLTGYGEGVCYMAQQWTIRPETVLINSFTDDRNKADDQDSRH
jgi:GNAT superfamily N-acetyltransferase